MRYSIRTLSITEGLWDIVENGYAVPPIKPKENEAWDDNKRKEYEENQKRDVMLFY